jgi:hypothetical protein
LARARLEALPGAVGLRDDGDGEQAREAGVATGRGELEVAPGAQRRPLAGERDGAQVAGRGELLGAELEVARVDKAPDVLEVTGRSKFVVTVFG